MGQIGAGGSAKIQQSNINTNIDFAFKRLSPYSDSLPSDDAFYRALLSEILILGAPAIQNHPNVLRLEGICWDIDSFDETVYPVLVFGKALYGDLGRFKATPLKNLTLSGKMLLCAHIANAVGSLHSYGLLSIKIVLANTC